MLFKALFDFSPEEADELQLKIGDTVEVDVQVAGANWGSGKNTRTGKKGEFPWNYVEKIADGDAPPPIVPRRGSSASSPAIIVKDTHRYENVTTKAALPAPTAASSPAIDLSKYPWFASGFDRQRAEDAMVDRPDGTFLVRPSKSHKGFTLSVRFDETRHVMIMERGGQYGFSEPCTFNSVLEIVEFFQRESLACYNAELETKLLYPYTTAPIAEAIGPAEEDEDEDEDLYVTNRQALRMQRHRREDGVQIKLHDYGDTYEEIREDTVKHKAQMQIVMLLKEQRQLADKINLMGADHDKIQENRDRLKARLFDAERNMELLDSRLTSAKENFEKRKEAAEATSGASRGVERAAGSGSGFKEDLDRKAAETMLEGAEDGHYIIRRSNTRISDPYTLTMRFEGLTKHIQIKFDGTRYGLAEPLAFYSILDLCDFYTTTPLSTTITKCLTVAVNAL